MGRLGLAAARSQLFFDQKISCPAPPPCWPSTLVLARRRLGRGLSLTALWLLVWRPLPNAPPAAAFSGTHCKAKWPPFGASASNYISPGEPPWPANRAVLLAMTLRNNAGVYAGAAALRFILFAAFPRLPDLLTGRVEISTPVTSFKRCTSISPCCNF